MTADAASSSPAAETPPWTMPSVLFSAELLALVDHVRLVDVDRHDLGQFSGPLTVGVG